MLQTIKSINDVVNGLVWGVPAMVCIIGVGILLSVRTGFIQFRKFPYAMKATLGKVFKKSEAAQGSITPFQAVCTALAATVGTGNIAGVAGFIAHATADTKDPVEQGVFGIFEVFADTIVICTLTALTILCSGVPIEFGAAAGAELTISGFTATYGSWVSIFTAVAMICFAFSTILGWGLYGARCMEFLGSAKFIKPFMVVYSLMGIVGATMDLGLLWSIAETFNGLMAIPNLIALFLLSGTVVKLVKEKFHKRF